MDDEIGGRRAAFDRGEPDDGVGYAQRLGRRFGAFLLLTGRKRDKQCEGGDRSAHDTYLFRAH